MKALDVSMPEEAHDPFTLDIIKNALGAIADEMAITVARTARSFVVKEALDFSTALFNAGGDLIAQGTCLPLHMGAMPFAIEAVERAFGGDMRPGDIYVMNDPWDGSTHLPDVVCVKPVFMAGALVGYAAALAHQTDIGGRVAGGNASDSTEIYQEGLRLPPVRLYDAGEPVDAIFRIIGRNVRVPDTVLGDIRSEVAACAIGERQLIDLIGKYGKGPFEAWCQELLDYTERFTRSEIAKLPDGSYRFTDWIDDDGIDPDPIVFSCCITVHGDDLTVDFEGTAPQVRGAINSVFPFTASAAWACVRAVLDGNIPNNAGYFRPIEVKAPKRSIVNADPPSPVAARGLAGFRIADSVMGCLAQIVPDLVPASGGNAPEAGISLGGYEPDGTPFVYLEFLVGSWGGGPHRDGMDACTGIIVNYSNTPVELLETEQPLLIERYAFVEDSGGPGEYRGRPRPRAAPSVPVRRRDRPGAIGPAPRAALRPERRRHRGALGRADPAGPRRGRADAVEVPDPARQGRRDRYPPCERRRLRPGVRPGSGTGPRRRARGEGERVACGRGLRCRPHRHAARDRRRSDPCPAGIGVRRAMTKPLAERGSGWPC